MKKLVDLFRNRRFLPFRDVKSFLATLTLRLAILMCSHVYSGCSKNFSCPETRIFGFQRGLILFFFILALPGLVCAEEGCPSGPDIFSKTRRVESILNLKEYLDFKVVYSSILKDFLSEIQKPGTQIEMQSSVSKLSQSSQQRYSHKICCYDMYANHSHQPFAELCLGK